MQQNWDISVGHSIKVVQHNRGSTLFKSILWFSTTFVPSLYLFYGGNFSVVCLHLVVVCVFILGTRLMQTAQSILCICGLSSHCEMAFLRPLTVCHINLMQHYAAGVYSWPPLRAAPWILNVITRPSPGVTLQHCNTVPGVTHSFTTQRSPQSRPPNTTHKNRKQQKCHLRWM